MTGGILHVEGNIQGDVGACMKGGEIHVSGKIGGSIGALSTGGQVYRNGKKCRMAREEKNR